MELPEIGKHCSVAECKQLDFLPYTCACKLIFCQEHFREHVETCTEIKKNTITAIENDTTVYICAKEGCKERSIVPLICQKCNRHFCVKHRHIVGCEEVDEEELRRAREKVEAPRQQFREAKAIVDNELDRNLAVAKKKSRTAETATKVQLMRLKGKAVGLKTIPISDRLYFLFYNVKYVPDGKAVFVARDWSIGRSIDAIAVECKMPNSNNVATAEKLRLFKKCDNEILTTDMSVKMEQLIEKRIVVNGDSLIIDYI